MNHTEHLNKLITENGYKSYLEIGYGTGENFKVISAATKVTIDPNITGLGEGLFKGTSDEYFEQLDGRTKFDLIFIDGLHHCDQVERDILNSWKHLKKGGAIVLHDVWPTNEEMTHVPRETKQWAGDVFKAFHGLVDTYPALKWELSKDDYGIATIWFDKDVKIEPGFTSNISYADYKGKYGA